MWTNLDLFLTMNLFTSNVCKKTTTIELIETLELIETIATN